MHCRLPSRIATLAAAEGARCRKHSSTARQLLGFARSKVGLAQLVEKFHKPGENHLTEGYIVTGNTASLLQRHLEATGGKVGPPHSNELVIVDAQWCCVECRSSRGFLQSPTVFFTSATQRPSTSTSTLPGYETIPPPYHPAVSECCVCVCVCGWLMMTQAHGGLCYLRYDDTNPGKADKQFIRQIEEMVKWLGVYVCSSCIYIHLYLPLHSLQGTLPTRSLLPLTISPSSTNWPGNSCLRLLPTCVTSLPRRSEVISHLPVHGERDQCKSLWSY